MKKIFFATVLSASCVALSLSSCKQFDDVLDRKPLDKVSPEVYYKSAEQMKSFTIDQYKHFSSPQGSWVGDVARDKGTDDQARMDDPNKRMFHLDHWKVPAEGGLGMGAIRNINWFLEQVVPNIKEGKISGAKAEIDQCLGEAYFFRALLYFGKLKTYGDFPIVEKTLSDDSKELIESAKRMPRSKVARFILKDLDKAIEILKDQTAGKQRISKDVARLFKSRVALYEGTFEKYHKGSGRVPGDANWPGKDKEWNKGKTFNIDAEVAFFLKEAKKEAKLVADKFTLTANNHVMNPAKGQIADWNPYYDMFASLDLSGNPEVLLWKQYNLSMGIKHHTSHRIHRGTDNGYTRGLVQSFLMKNGLPIYAAGSNYKGDETIDDVKTDRDERLQLFMFSESTPLLVKNRQGVEVMELFLAPTVTSPRDGRDVTGYRQRKFYNYDPAVNPNPTQSDVTATIIFRASEAYLNYIEACYVLTNALDGDAKKYWTALRNRAGITADINATISATDMGIEANVNTPSYDWAAFSAGQPVDATLYSIRRERRCEFIAEGFRMDDLKRWRAMDQVKNYQVEGINFWTKIKDYKYRNAKEQLVPYDIKADGSSDANMSAESLGKYLRPYQIVKTNNDMYDGYTFYQAHYLSPFSYKEMLLCSPNDDASSSNLYQNPDWKVEPNTPAQK